MSWTVHNMYTQRFSDCRIHVMMPTVYRYHYLFSKTVFVSLLQGMCMINTVAISSNEVIHYTRDGYKLETG